MRTVLAALALLLAAFGLAQSGGSFASLVITSAGDEEFDIATGVTTLLEGGEIRDQGSGIVLTAPWISYKVDEYIETRDTTVTGSFGRVTGETVHVDIPSSKLTAGCCAGVLRSSKNVLKKFVRNANKGAAPASVPQFRRSL